MRTDEFEVTVAGTRGTFDDILPGLTTADRIAIVTHTPGGSLAAAPLLLAAVGRYYEILRRERDEFYRYPGYFVVHVGELRAYHGWLDVWPEHKEVVVAAHAEAVLEALYDRDVTRVLLEAAPAGTGNLMRETANWFLEDVRDILGFTPGRGAGALTVRPSAAAARLVRRAVEASRGIVPEETGAGIQDRARQRQAFDRLTALEGLQQLCGYGPVPEVIGQGADYLARHGANREVMAAHQFRIE